MNPSDWTLRARQIFGILTPGVVWAFSGLMLLHYPHPPIQLITSVKPSWVEAATFLGASFVVGFALRKISWGFSGWASNCAAARMPRLFEDTAMKDRAEELRTRVSVVIQQRYAHLEGFKQPDADRVFGFCKRVLRGASPELYDHLDNYEDEINLLKLIPLPLFAFALVWFGTWFLSDDGIWNRYAFPIAIAAVIAALFCLAQYLPLKWAEHKEIFESFLAFHLESPAKPEKKT
jgi:hypothetical protein